MKLIEKDTKLFTENGVCLGFIITEVDGNKYFYNQPNSGLFSSYNLRLIADYLDEANKEWDDIIKGGL